MSDEILELLYFIASFQKEDAEKLIPTRMLFKLAGWAAPVSIRLVALYYDFDLYGGFQVFRVYM